MNADALRKAIDLVRRLTGISMNAGKKALIAGRLRKRVQALSLARYEQYLDYVADHAEEVQEFINLVTTNETSFFRTSRVWDFLLTDFLPSWRSTHPDETLKIWSAATSTGEEAYSIGICCLEMKSRHPLFRFQIVATDIDTDVLACAAKGEYGGRSIENFRAARPALFAKYMKKSETGYAVSDEARSHLEFKTHHLFHRPDAGDRFHLIFLRNVLIYFEAGDQEKVLANLRQALVPDGLLIIGESESLARLKTDFQYKAPLVYQLAEGEHRTAGRDSR